ncbi:unnamed protein product [Orchesella dallaii]|uniref:Uncharacterized protein n=1 Tax=Orchesella dallaii TaxID=48710 RepID=A0ABP1RXE1_9HEXA
MGGGITVIITGLPVYFLLVRKKRIPNWLQTLNINSTLFLQKALNLETEEQFHQD